MSLTWETLSPAERALVTATSLGEICELAPADAADKPAIRAALIRALLLGLAVDGAPDAQVSRVRLAGVRMRGACLIGTLDLRACRGVGDVGLPGLGLFGCVIEQHVLMRHARIARLSFQDSRFTHIEAHGLHIDGPLDLSNVGPVTEGGDCSVDASAAVISGEVRVKGANLKSPARAQDLLRPWNRWYALRLSDARIEGGVNLSDGFVADGGVTISAARIDGDVWLSGARLIARESRALNARSAQLGGMVMLIDGFYASGPVSFQDAVVQGRVSCSEGTADAGAEPQPTAPGLSPSGRYAFARIDGELDLRGAEFRSSVELGGGWFVNRGHWAINAAGVKVGGDFRLRPASDHRQFPTMITGGLRLEGAEIGGELIWENLILEGPCPREVSESTRRRLLRQEAARRGKPPWWNPFGWGRKRRDGKLEIKLTPKQERHVAQVAAAARITIADARIGRAFKARRLEVAGALEAGAFDAVIDLTGAKCAALDDDLQNGWGQPDRKVWVMMEGFTYARLELDVREQKVAASRSDRWVLRKRWIWEKSGRFEGFHPQPYNVLARFYREVGWSQDLSRCLEHERFRHMLQAPGGIWLAPITRTFSFFFWLMSGFGHRPLRILLILMLYWAIGAHGVHQMNRMGRLVIDSTYLAQPNSSATIARADDTLDIRCGAEIEPAIYALDVAIPLLDLRQEVQCEPGITLAQGQAAANGGAAELAFWRWMKLIYALVGALLTAVAAITFSGFARREGRE